MSVLAFIESNNGSFKKSDLEVASYAAALAAATNTEAIALVFNSDDCSPLGTYGISKALKVSTEQFNASSYAATIEVATTQEAATVLICSSSSNSKYIAPLVAASLKAAYVPNVIALPESGTYPRNVFSNKGIAHTKVNSELSIIGIAPNTYGVHENPTQINQIDFNLVSSSSKTQSTSTETASDKISIADADIVVSAGRGLKGPENWGMIEELAQVLGAATACSKPVSDMGWRPHSEHVGQTGKPVSCNLYFAIGISGAIQHLAGVSASKTKVVINTDPEAPFFKAADYGIVGDAFEVVPQLIEKLKAFKSENS
ncbi:MAG: electron transfer flavoprotein subunit alpha/FixB family protein [Flavobacteriaceae bacterium]|jgi:electron transfer flavoprotein alpha subunit|nr:electron transfer flavoprotein subunit alpha/FixB family protein [Flavobacteriaceae bacterium]NVJ72356.1 electron transfer flavoprotein subunit alpha/FixB family protein [Flavobacteriaceae bacterium]